MTLNDSIINAPVVLFLGAGASAALGNPMMADFLDGLGPRLEYDQSSILRALIHFRGKDLESILTDLDTIIGLDYGSVLHLKYVRPPDYVSKTPEDNPPSIVTSEIRRETALSLKIRIQQAIVEEYGKIESDRLIPSYLALFTQIFSKVHARPLPVFTTNYDPAIEDFCSSQDKEFHLTDGFTHDDRTRHYLWRRSAFDNFGPTEDRADIVLFKLHGSADWIRMPDGSVRRERPHWHGGNDAYKNVLIYPAMYKVAIDDPYYTGYDYYQRCCDRARICIVIGYSFRDYDALTRLRSAMTVNPALRVVVIAPNADDLRERIWGATDRKPALKFHFGFSEDRGYEEHLEQQLKEALPSKAATP